MAMACSMPAMETVTRENWYWRWLPPLLWLVVLCSCMLELHLRSDWYAGYLFDRLRVYQEVSEADALHAAVYQTLFGESAMAETSFSDAERQHFHDVAGLLDLNRCLLLGSALLLLGLSLWRRQLACFWMRIGTLYVVAALLALMLISTRWLLFFRGMHPLLFSHSHWDFHPNDLIIQMYPEILLAIVATAIVLSILVLALILYWLGSRFNKEPLFECYRWDWHKRYVDITLFCFLFCVPWWIFGVDMLKPGGLSWIIYWVLCLLVLTASLYLVICRNTARAALMLFIAVVWLQAFAEGVANTTRQAQYVLEQGGLYYQGLIKEYRKEHQTIPPDSQTLRSFAQEQLPEEAKKWPAFTQRFGAWTYKPLRDGHYILYFPGPLGFEFSYHSRTEYWNAMREP